MRERGREGGREGVRVSFLIFISVKFFSSLSVQVRDQLESSQLRLQRLASQAALVRDSCQQNIGTTSNEVQRRIATAMGDVVAQMSSLVEACPATFESAHIESYKQALFEHMDSSLEAELSRVSSSVLGGLQETAWQRLIGALQLVPLPLL